MPNGQPPQGMEQPGGEMPPTGDTPPEKPGEPPKGHDRNHGNGVAGNLLMEFRILNGANMFGGIVPMQ